MNRIGSGDVRIGLDLRFRSRVRVRRGTIAIGTCFGTCFGTCLVTPGALLARTRGSNGAGAAVEESGKMGLVPVQMSLAASRG